MNRKICLQVLVSGSQVLVRLSFSWKVIYLWFMDLVKFIEEPLEVWPGNLKIKNNTWYVCVLNFFFFRRRTYTFNPLHKPYYNSYNSLINTERKITTIIWVIYLIRLANESVITWTIIRLRQGQNGSKSLIKLLRELALLRQQHGIHSSAACVWSWAHSWRRKWPHN